MVGSNPRRDWFLAVVPEGSRLNCPSGGRLGRHSSRAADRTPGGREFATISLNILPVITVMFRLIQKHRTNFSQHYKIAYSEFGNTATDAFSKNKQCPDACVLWIIYWRTILQFLFLVDFL